MSVVKINCDLSLHVEHLLYLLHYKLSKTRQSSVTYLSSYYWERTAGFPPVYRSDIYLTTMMSKRIVSQENVQKAYIKINVHFYEIMMFIDEIIQ